MGGGEPIGVAGWSAGGRIALALAARHPQLVNRVVVLGTPAPHEHIPWIPRDQHLLLERLGGMPPATARTTIMQHLTAIIPSEMRDETALSLLAVSANDDMALAQPATRDRLRQMLTAAFTQGAVGLASEITGYGLHPWGFEPKSYRRKRYCYTAPKPLLLTHGMKRGDKSSSLTRGLKSFLAQDIC